MMIREAQAQLAGPMYMNSREDAAIAVKGMESRVHQDNEELRKKGVKQYLHTVKKKHNQKILDKEAAVSTEVDLSKEQYEQVNEHMSDERNPGHTEPGKTNGTTPGRRRRTAGQNQNDNGGTPKEQTPEEKAKEGAVAEFTKGVAATKTLHDKLARELGDVCLIEAILKAKRMGHVGADSVPQGKDRSHQGAQRRLVCTVVGREGVSQHAVRAQHRGVHHRDWEVEKTQGRGHGGVQGVHPRDAQRVHEAEMNLPLLVVLIARASSVLCFGRRSDSLTCLALIGVPSARRLFSKADRQTSFPRR